MHSAHTPPAVSRSVRKFPWPMLSDAPPSAILSSTNTPLRFHALLSQPKAMTAIPARLTIRHSSPPRNRIRGIMHTPL